MVFESRRQAGRLLANKLAKYQGREVVIYALPRGGVVPAAEVAKSLGAPLQLLVSRKIGHPFDPEYAIAAVTSTEIALNPEETWQLDKKWLDEEIRKARTEISRRRQAYWGDRPEASLAGKVAIVVDDGLATGLTMQASLMELKKHGPEKIVVAVPVAATDATNELAGLADEILILHIPTGFFGSIGSYYLNFPQVSDAEVRDILAMTAKEGSAIIQPEGT